MIGKGAQYLTAAGFGRYRITAASLGSNLMFGSLWLNYAAQQAIMAAFGVDGTAVIRATNEYLNGIAASDKAKATALAGFINQHPLDAALYGGLYVQDGLVFQMDRAYECTAAKWTDFIGGIEFIGNGSVQIDADNVPTFNGSGYYVSNTQPRHAPNTHTIEVVYYASTGISHIYIENWSRDDVGIAAGTNNTNIRTSCGDGVQLTTNIVPTNRINTFSRGSAGYVNGQAAQTDVANAWSANNKNKAYIGCRYEGYQVATDLKVYSIRIYNRLLTEAEILANQEIDLKRWTPPTP